MSERVNATNLVDFQVGISPPDAIGLRLVTGDGGNLTVRINRAAVGNLIFQMLARASSLPDQPDAPSIETPVLSAIGGGYRGRSSWGARTLHPFGRRSEINNSAKRGGAGGSSKQTGKAGSGKVFAEWPISLSLPIPV